MSGRSKKDERPGIDILHDDAPLAPEKKEKRKISPKIRFLIYFILIIVLTAAALTMSLYGNFEAVVEALGRSDWRYLLLIVGLVLLGYLIDSLILFIFVRLYTRHYHFHQSVATSMVGAFYSAVTPGASGGQIMQAYTLKKQGIEISNGTSIMIMSFIVYQLALIFLGSIAVFFKWDLIASIGTFQFGPDVKTSIPAIPMTILGFLYNISVILFLFIMSYSRHVHNFIMNHGISFLAKLKIVKKPDRLRESLRVQVENFKIELRRLLSNIPVFILVFVCFFLMLIVRFSIPYFAGLALNGFGELCGPDAGFDAAGQPLLSTGQPGFKSFWDAVFLSSYHQMTTGLLPLPGSAGVSEYFFDIIFKHYYVSAEVTTAAQIIWRFCSFHLVLLISGIVAATYRASPRGEGVTADRRAFVTLQLETYELRRATSDTLYETGSLSLLEIRKRLKRLGRKKKKKEKTEEKTRSLLNKEKTAPPKKPVERKKESKAPPDADDQADWIEIETGDDSS